MTQVSRRRFLMISAATATLAGLPGIARAAFPVTHWRGVAMGSAASISLAHPDADAIIKRALAEIARLENIFSLYRPNSTLMQLNAHGRIDAPPFDLLECLGLCNVVHTASNGLFDPTIQPLWQLYARHYANGQSPHPDAIKTTLLQTGWNGVRYDQNGVQFDHPGMAITLNGVAQGYVADRVAALLRTEGLTDILVNTGEFHALGGHPDGGDWPVSIDTGSGILTDVIPLRDRALATSSPRGTVFDAQGKVGHILDPRNGAAGKSPWQSISVSAPDAALADALSTAMCLMTRPEITALLAAFPKARLVHLA
ncbi:MAG: FAD:protein FMN transferase [Pseudomonadota bacterium]